MDGWQIRHKEVILDVLKTIQLSAVRYILKGGTALMISYGLTRFSEDVDLDQPDGAADFFLLMDDLAERRRWSCRHAKDTQSVKRAFLHYGGDKPLKVEVSMRESYVPESFYRQDPMGFYVYTVQALTRLKCAAYSGRDKIRDAYDLSFLVTKYLSEMDEELRHSVRQAFAGKGFGNADYLIHSQPDVLVDNTEFLNMYLDAWVALGLIH